MKTIIITSVYLCTLFLCSILSYAQTAEDILKDLEDDRAQIRVQAVQKLLQLKEKDMIDGLAKALEDDEESVRTIVITALNRIQEKEALINIALHDTSDTIRCAAIATITEKEYKNLLPDLISILRYSSVRTRHYVIAAFKKLGGKEVVTPLIDALNYTDEDIRKEAAEALAKLSDSAALEPLIKKLGDLKDKVRKSALDSLLELEKKLGLPPTNLLIMALSEKDNDGRKWAAEKLGESKAEEGVKPLCNALSDPLIDVRETAVQSLAKIGNTSAVPYLAKLLFKEEDRTRLKVIQALVDLKDKEAGKALIQLLNEEASYLKKGGDQEARGVLVKAVVKALADLEIPDSYEPVLRVSQIGVQGVDQAAQAALARIEKGVDRVAIPSAIQSLKDPNPAIRRRAVEFLGKVGDTQVLTHLISPLDDSDDSVRFKAINALSQIESRHGNLPIDILSKALKIKYSEIRLWAVQTIGKSSRPDGVKPVLSVLKDPDPKVREASIIALIQIGDKSVVSAIAPLLNDPEKDVRKKAVEGLGALGDRTEVAPLLSAMLQKRYKNLREKPESTDVLVACIQVLVQKQEPSVIEDLLTLMNFPELKEEAQKGALTLKNTTGNSLIPYLLNALENQDENVRIQAASIISEVGNSEIIDSLIPKLKDPSPEVRKIIILALTRFGDARIIVPHILPKINDGEKEVRLSAIEALAELKAQQNAGSLLVVLEDKDEDIQEKAIEALGKLQYQEGIELIATFLTNPKSKLREKAINALVNIGKPSVPVLLRYLKNKDGDVRRAAAKALGEIRDTDSVNELSLALQDSDPRVQKEAKEALAKFSEQSSVQVLLLKEKDQKVREKAMESLEDFTRQRNQSDKDIQIVTDALISALGDPSPKVRYLACKGLGQLKAERASKPIMDIIGDGDPKVREWAAWALGQLKPKEAINAFLSMISDPNPRVRCNVVQALAVLKSREAISPLMELLIRDEDPEVRAKTAWALGEMGDSKASPPLKASLRDPTVEVACVAAEALGKIKDTTSVFSLQGALKAEQLSLRAAAAFALARIQTDQAMSVLKDSQIEKDIIQGFSFKDKSSIIWVIKAAGELKLKEAVPYLVELLKDKDADIQYAVQVALSKIPDERTSSIWIDALKGDDQRLQLISIDALIKTDDSQYISPIFNTLNKLWEDENRVYKTPNFGDGFKFVFKEEYLFIFKEDELSSIVLTLKQQTPVNFLGEGFKLVKKSNTVVVIKRIDIEFNDGDAKKGQGSFITAQGDKGKINWEEVSSK